MFNKIRTNVNNNAPAIQVLIAIVTILFTFFALYISNRGLEQQRKTELIQNRAYLSLEDVVISPNNINITFTIINNGNTPAYSVRFDSNLTRTDFWGLSDAKIDYLGPHQTRTLTKIWNREKSQEFLKVKKKFFDLDISYKDYQDNSCNFISSLYTATTSQNLYKVFFENQAESPCK